MAQAGLIIVWMVFRSGFRLTGIGYKSTVTGKSRVLHCCFGHKWNLTWLDKLHLSSWLVTLASGLSSNHLTSKNLPSQIVNHFLFFSPKYFRCNWYTFWVVAKHQKENVLGIILRCSAQRKKEKDERLHFNWAVLLRRWWIVRNNW